MMIQFLFTLTQLVFLIKAGFLTQETEVGCKIANQSPCTELCLLGVEDCSTTTPICEYGYFLFTLSNPQTCVQCPYQSTNDVLTMYCMDCVENPYTWDFSRKCTYDYYIGNGDPTYGTYQLSKKSYSELYFVGTMQDALTWSGTITRSKAVLYQTFVCSGCDNFCTLDDSNCSKMTNSYITIDTNKVGIKCLQGYYFWQDLCKSCSIKNCMNCDNDKCNSCQVGYATDDIGLSCQTCPDNCGICHYEGTQLWCDECDSTDDQAYVVSLDRLLCEPCGTNCKRCEYLTYVSTELQAYPSRAKTQINANQDNFLKRCQQCAYGSQGLNFDGIQCEDCQIYNCETCYYILRISGGESITTIDMDFEPLKSSESEPSQMCLKCKTGYFLSQDKLSCTEIASLPPASNIVNCKIYKQTGPAVFKCWECVEGFILDQNTGTCFGACSDYIKNCKYCFSYNSLDIEQTIDSSGTVTNQDAQKLFQCYLCNSGYYPDFFTGECVLCQTNCQQCWQYTLSHNFTQYLSLQVVLTDTKKSAFQTYSLQDPYCSLCLTGYISIDNQCKGCTSNCVISSPTRDENDPSSILSSMCTYTDTSVFCGQCYNSFRDRSLVTDMSECHECPLNCVACRDRTTAENNQINPYFNPTSLSLQKYGKLCYKYQTNSIATEAIDYLTYLNLPISCTYSTGKTKKCKRKTSAAVSIYCDDIEFQTAFGSATPDEQQYMFSLGKFYSKNNGNSATISFDNLETLTTYEQMNKLVIEEMEFTINFIKLTDTDSSFDSISRKECSFKKTTIISVNFQKNVFSLRKFTLIISGSNDASNLMRLYLDGYIQIPAQNRIIFKGFDINYKPQATSNAYFGLQINQNDQTELILQDCKFGRYNKTIYSDKLIMNLNNAKTLSMINTEYYNLRTTDIFNITYTVTQINTLSYYFNKVVFTKMELYNTTLFKLDKILFPEINVNIGDDGMIFNQCIFNKSEIFGEATDNQAQTGQITLNKVVIKYSYFNNSYFLNLQTTNLTIINNLDVISSDFYQSIFINSNSFQILNSYIYSNTFRNSSRLLANPDKIIDDYDIAQSIREYSFKNMKFLSNSCQNIQCFVALSTPTSNYGYLTNITFENITIQETSSFLISEKESYSVKSSLFYLTDVGKIIILGLQTDNNFGITILSAIKIESFRLEGGLYDWTKDSYGIQPDDVTNSTDTPGDKILLPQNNKLPASWLCASRKIEYKSFSQFYLFISQFLYGVSISNVVIRRQLSIDTIFIKIISWDIEHTNTTSETIFKQMEFYDGFFKEQIYLKNIRFIGNSLTVTQANSNAASVQIESSQLQIIVIDGMQFIDNHLHCLVPNVIEQSATTLLINSPIATVNISNSIFNKNRATRISSGIFQIICSELNMMSNQFNNTNIMELDWIYRIEEFQFNTDTDNDIISNMDSFFKVLSIGGNANIKAEYIKINSTTFDKGYAIKGAGLYFETIDSGEITISNSYFANQFNTLENQYVSNGGCLYIDSSNSKLSLKLDTVTMQNCVTRRQGGCVYIETSTLSHDVVIQDSKFTQCQALLQAVLYANFPTASAIEPEIQIYRSKFFGNNMINFIRNIPDILQSEIDYLSTESTAIGLNYGYLSIESSEFQDFNYTSVLKMTSMIQLSFNDLVIKNNAILILQLVYVTLYNTFGTIQISKSSFQNNNQYYTLSLEEFDLTFADGYSSYLTTYTTVDLAIQTCGMLQYLDTLFRLLDAQAAALITGLYSSEDEAKYNLMSSLQKYDYPFISVDELVTYTSLDIFDPSTTFTIYKNYENNISITKAILSYIVLIYSGITFPTALFYLQSLSSNQMVNISSLDIESNECIRCYGGLLQIFSVIETNTPTINLEDINCQQNVIGYYGCISVSNQSAMSDFTLVLPITDYPIINTSARLLSVTSDLASLQHQVRLDQSNFFKNRAKIGTGISIVGMNALITLTDFSDNVASLVGGCVLFKSLYSNSLLLFGNTLQGNSAQLAGGIFIYDGSLPNETAVETYFSNNVGTLKGSNLEEYPQKLSITMKNESTIFTVKTFLNYSGDSDGDGYIDSTSVNIIDIVDIPAYTIPNYKGQTNYLILPSGQKISTYKYYYSYTEEQVPFEWIFRILNLDRFKQSMSNIDKTNQCKITGRMMDSNNFNDSTAYLSNFTSPTYVYFDDSVGQYNLDDLIIYFDPKLADNYYLQLKFVCSSISVPVYMTTSPYTTIGYNSNYALLVNIRTFPCQLGEAYNQMQCLACSQAEQTYAVDLNQLQCNSINSATMDKTTPVAIKLKATYWRAEYDLEQIEYCTNLPSNCNGGWKPGNPSCYTGHMGGLCESCDIYATRSDQSYSISSKYTCGSCADTVAVNSIVITALSIVTLVSMTLSVKGNYQMLEDFVRNLRLMSMGILISQSGSNLAILIKLFTNYFQIISSLTSFQLSLPSSLTSTATVVGNPTQTMSYSLDCFLVDLSNIDILYFRMIWALVMPIAYLAIFFFGYFLAVAINKLPYKSGIIYTTFIYMFIYLQPTLVGGFISLASSRSAGGISWVQADVLYQYDSNTHIYWMLVFVLPLLLAWSIVFPCIFMYLVYRIKGALNDVDNRKRLGYFYNEYTQEGYLWEFVKIFEKELIIIVLTYYEDRIVVKGLIIFLIVFIYGVFTIKFHPYSSKKLNIIDRLATAICAVSICLGVLIYAAQKEELNYITYIMFIIVGVLNGGFILLMIYYLFEGYLIKFQSLLDKIRDRVRIRYPDLQEYPLLRKALLNREKLGSKVKVYWAVLRYNVRQGIKRRREDPNLPLFKPPDIEQVVIKPYGFTPGILMQAKTIGNETPMNKQGAKIHPLENQDSPMVFSQIE